MSQPQSVSLSELAKASFKVGCLGFGGPAGQIALMHRVFVEEKKWISDTRYMHALNFCMLLPGPEAQQLATYAGWMLNGVRGGVIAGLLFVLPGALIVFALSWIYILYGHLPLAASLFLGVKAAVLAFIFDALLRIGRKAMKSRKDAIIAAAAFAALYVFGLPFPLTILAAAAFGAVTLTRRDDAPTDPAQQPDARVRGTIRTALIWGAAWLAPVFIVAARFGPDHVLTQIAVLFSKLAVVTFGGAYAVLAYLQQQAVDIHGWLAPEQMIDGLGLAETTPGPLILVNQFVGFLAGWQAADGGFLFALAGAALASWCTFAPSFVWIFAGAPYAERLRQSRLAAGALRAVTAAVLGVIASLSLWFGQHVLFRENAAIATPWGKEIALPLLETFEWSALAIALAAGLALIRYKANAALVVGACALLGLLTAFPPLS